MIACNREALIARIPDCSCEGSAQHRPDGVAEFFPCGQKNVRVRPCRCFWARSSNPIKQIIAIVKAELRRAQRSCCALPRLSVESVFRHHAHERMNKTRNSVDNDFRTIGTVLIERIHNALELVTVDLLAVESQYPDDSAQ